MGEIQAVIASQRDGTDLSYFQATPVNGAAPCLFRALYFVTRENGHWVYRLQPGSLAIVPHQTVHANRTELRESDAAT